MAKAVSLNPEDFTEGGGLIDDVDAVLSSCLFEMYDYNGKVASPVPALLVKLEVEDFDEPIDQYYSMGSNKDWAPSEDGSQLVAIGKSESIKVSSNGGIFLKSLIDAGYPADNLGDNITILDGLQAHLIRVPAPKRAGIKKKEREDGREFENTILVISEIIAMPGEKKKPAGAPASKKAGGTGGTKKDTAEKEEASGSVEDKASGIILEIISGGPVSKKELPAKIFQSMKSDPDRNAVVKLAFDDNFLSSGPWTYEDETVS